MNKLIVCFVFLFSLTTAFSVEVVWMLINDQGVVVFENLSLFQCNFYKEGHPGWVCAVQQK